MFDVREVSKFLAVASLAVSISGCGGGSGEQTVQVQAPATVQLHIGAGKDAITSLSVTDVTSLAVTITGAGMTDIVDTFAYHYPDSASRNYILTPGLLHFKVEAFDAKEVKKYAGEKDQRINVGVNEVSIQIDSVTAPATTGNIGVIFHDTEPASIAITKIPTQKFMETAAIGSAMVEGKVANVDMSKVKVLVLIQFPDNPTWYLKCPTSGPFTPVNESGHFKTPFNSGLFPTAGVEVRAYLVTSDYEYNDVVGANLPSDPPTSQVLALATGYEHRG